MPTTRLTRRAVALAVAATTTAGLLAAAGARSARPALAAGTATINGGTTFQTITGFGASEAFNEAATVMSASSSVQQQVLQDLYGTTTGAGLTILRNEVSA